MNCYAQQAVFSGLQTILPANRSPRLREIARLNLPYLLHPIFGGERYILLNRHYKPLGVGKDIYCYYERPQYSSLVVNAADIDFSVFKDEQRVPGYFYFYSGFAPDGNDYAKKVIAALKIDAQALV